MPQSNATVSTLTPRRFLVQLCKHFEHKLAVTQEADSGSIAFSVGTCRLRSTSDTLVLQAEADSAENLAQLQDVVARHLLRFAFRAPPEIVWHPA
jgi:hypothetical protein